MVQKFETWFTPAGENRRIHLWLPEDYDRSDERYPVLYMFDGHNLFFDSDATFGHALHLGWFLDGWWKKLIVVGLECAADDNQRVHEYCPFGLQSSIYGWIEGRGDATLRWMAEELKPYIDSRYRTWPQREATAIAGYSMGGMMSLYAVLHYNSVFSKAAVISPAILPAMDGFRHELANDSLSPDTRVFFSWGTDEDSPDVVWRTEQAIREVEAGVQQRGASTWLCCQPGGHHNEQSWEQQVPEWMKFLWE